MTERIARKIEEIRLQPEHVRLQYALGAVLVCMIFVLGVWILTLREGFLGVSAEMEEQDGTVENSISTVRQTLPTDSLRTLQEQSESIRLNTGNANNADQFIEGELQRSTNNQNVPN